MDIYQVQAQELNYCDYLIQYFSSKKAVEDKENEAIALLKENKIKGFRPGKAPRQVIQNLFKKEIEDYISVKLSPEAYKDALFETKINPLGAPQFTRMNLENGKFFCEFRQLSKPKIELHQYKEFEIPKPHPAFNISEKVEGTLQELRMKHAELMPFSNCEAVDSVQKGDRLTLNIEVKDAFDPDQKMIEQMSHQDLSYVLGQNLYPGFDEQIEGMQMDEIRKFNLRLPKEKDPDLKGDSDTWAANFKVTLTMAFRPIPHPLDDELAQMEGLENFSALELALHQRAEQLLKQSEKVALQQQLINRLCENHVFKIPEWLLEQEIRQLQTKDQQKGIDIDNVKYYAQIAEQNLRLTFLLEEIRKAEPESGLSDMELIESLKRQVGDNQDLRAWLLEAEKNQQIATWLANARVEYVLEWLLNTCKIVEN